MTKQKFKEMLKTELEGYLPGDVKITFQEIAKINEVKTAIYVSTGVEGKSYAAPVVYLEDLYEMFEECGMDDVLLHVGRILNPDTAPTANEAILDAVRKGFDRVIPVLINREKNMAMLDKCPHTDVLDLSVIYEIPLMSDAQQKASARVTYNITSSWGVTTAQLHEKALANARASFTDIIKMSDMLAEAGLPEVKEDVYPPMFILTNKDRFKGATAILLKDVLQKLADKLKGDLVILPSSIHEVIVIPKDIRTNLDELGDMIREVNATQVAANEVLSDHPYIYVRETGTLE